jgi:hypothetical protein
MDSDDIEEIREPKFQDVLQKYVTKIGGAAIIIGILYYLYYQINLASNDKNAFTSNFVYNIFAIVVPIIGILCLILMTMFDTDVGIYIIIGTIFAISLCGMFFYFLQTTLSTYIFNKYLLYVVIAFSILISLSIIATLLSGTLRRQIGWTGFFANLIFYIPCLIRDAIKGAVNEYNSFSTTILVLFIIEIILLLMYFLLIPLFNTNVVPTNISLLDDPIMINTSMPLSVAPIYTGKGPWNNFSLSMWVYVNPAPNTKPGYTTETPIFTYTTGSSDYFFKLNYLNDSKKNAQFNLDISNSTVSNVMTGQSMNPTPLSMPLQKWNNIVFNMSTKDIPTGTDAPTGVIVIPKTTTTLDVFINGVLTHTFPLNSTPLFSASDRITVGSGSIDANIDGLYGAICNIVYYQQPLSRLSLIYNYNTLVVKNPPV